jgi:bifunctional UDP-N-acetylglucosamine pyrophosphorylase/glucosamine-1-phosphate N-acetyltransferase
MKKIPTSVFIDIDKFLYKDVFDSIEYPWEALENIKNICKTKQVVHGHNCVIAPTAVLREGVILGDNVYIGNFVEIKHSIILSNTRIPHLSYIGDAVIGNNVNFGAGSVCANFRFDEKKIVVTYKSFVYRTNLTKFSALVGDNVKIGANAVLLPGTLIEKNSYIYPLTSVKGHIVTI